MRPEHAPYALGKCDIGPYPVLFQIRSPMFSVLAPNCSLALSSFVSTRTAVAWTDRLVRITLPGVKGVLRTFQPDSQP